VTQQNTQLLKTDENQEIVSTDQTNSIFNEKQMSRFLSQKDLEEDDDLLRESILLSRRGSFHNQQKGSHLKNPSQ
jgi:hypothetical protein